jgi:bacillopeptidase F (M6 metalloprotease family)
MKKKNCLIVILCLFCFVLYGQVQTIVWSENFEGDWTQNWYAENGVWEVGIPTSGPGSAYSVQKCAATVLGGYYPPNASTRLVRNTPFIVPDASQNPRLRFWHWFSFDGDYGKVQIKPAGSPTWTDISGQYNNTGSSIWSCPLIDLSGYAGQQVQIAFLFSSNSLWESSGWYIDDISLVTGPIVFNNPEGWENGLGDWSAESGTWEVGIPISGPGSAKNNFFVENFTSKLGAFTAYNVSGDQTWFWAPFGNGCAKINAFEQGVAYANEDWLISPEISLIGKTDARMDFTELINYITSYEDLKVLISSDYDGVSNPSNQGNWTELTGFNRPPGNDWNWVNSGDISLSEFEGQTIHIAFKYVSHESGASHWEISSVKVKAGYNCAATNLYGNYASNVSSRLVSPPIVVPDASQNPRLRFWHWFSFDGDYGKVQVKPDGSSTWIDISGLYTNSGSETWSCPLINLSNYAGQQVQIAFLFSSNSLWESSGWYIDDISLVTGPIVFNNPEGWENDLGDWSAESGTWEVGSPTSGPNSAHTGQNCAATHLYGNYAGNASSRFVSPSFMVPNASQNPRLRFWHWFSFDGDYGKVQIKTSGSSTWIDISGQYINNGGNIWSYPLIDLVPYGGQQVQIAFLLNSNSLWESSGWYIDDVSVQFDPVVDQISLSSGWNLISFDVMKYQNSPESYFQPLISSNNLQMVTGYQNQQGVFYDPDGLPFLNTLQSIVPGEGYWVKLQSAATLTVEGFIYPPDYSIDLKAGWNLIGFWKDNILTPEQAFELLITAGILQMVTGYNEGGKFFDPNGPTFLNTLVEIQNGNGYWVKISNAYNGFTFP